MKHPLCHLFIIIAFGLISYSHTLNGPFTLDDSIAIESNPIIRDVSNFLNPSLAKDERMFGFFLRRYFSYASLAMNYHLNGLNPYGYHIFNLSIHLLNSILLYLLIVYTFKIPYLRTSSLRTHSGTLAFLISMIFVLHPVQTEAVNYILQRQALLSFFFYLLALLLFIKTCQTYKEKGHGTYMFILFYTGLICTIFLAVISKENALTLPIMLLLYHRFFFRDQTKLRVLFVVPLFLPWVLYLFILSQSGISAGGVLFGQNPVNIESIKEVDQDFVNPTSRRVPYLITQARVMVTYIRLLFFPANQNFFYDFPLYRSFLAPPIVMSSVFLILLFASSFQAFRYSKSKDRSYRLVSFGIIWFFLTLTVESSILPLPLLICEYRLYLPGIGIITAFICGVFLLREKVNSVSLNRALTVLFIVIISTLTVATYTRNRVWHTEISLWEDVVEKSPQKHLAHYNLGNAYLEKGFLDKAIDSFETARELEPSFKHTYMNLGLAYSKKSLFEQAASSYEAAKEIAPDDPVIFYDYARLLQSRGKLKEAIKEYKAALRLRPDFFAAQNNIASLYIKTGQIDQAIEHLEYALNLKPDSRITHMNLGIAYRQKGQNNKALEHFHKVLAADPNNRFIHLQLGAAYEELEQFDRAAYHYNQFKSR